MKVKELLEKYPKHAVVEMGYPDSLPFTELPKELEDLRGKEYDRVFRELEVKGYEVHNKPFVSIDITAALFGGKKKRNRHYEGHLYIYLKGDKSRRWNILEQ